MSALLVEIRVDSQETLARLHALAYARLYGLSPERIHLVPVYFDEGLPTRTARLVGTGYEERLFI